MVDGSREVTMPTYIFRIGAGGENGEPLVTVARSNEFVVATFQQALERAKAEIAGTPGRDRANRATLSEQTGMVLWSRNLMTAE